MCLSTTCHASYQLVTTSEEEFKVLIYLLLEMSLGMKAEEGERERKQGKQYSAAGFQDKNLALS